MTKAEKNITAFLKNYEKSAVKRLRELQATQSFDGTLKVRSDRVYIDKKDGRRALEHLRTLNFRRLAKAE